MALSTVCATAGPLTLIVWTIMIENIVPFAAIYAIVELGFALAFTAMFFERGSAAGISQMVRCCVHALCGHHSATFYHPLTCRGAVSTTVGTVRRLDVALGLH